METWSYNTKTVSTFVMTIVVMTFVVETQPAFRILASDEPNILGFDKSDVVGRSVMIFIGPKSDFSVLKQAITAITEPKSAKSTHQQMVMYDNGGNDHVMLVSCEPMLNGSEVDSVMQILELP